MPRPRVAHALAATAATLLVAQLAVSSCTLPLGGLPSASGSGGSGGASSSTTTGMGGAVPTDVFAELVVAERGAVTAR